MTIKHPLLLALLLLTTIQLNAKRINIKGLDISYSEDQQIMIASGNAELIHPDFKILANEIEYNKRKNIIHGKNNVEIIQNNQIILSDNFTYHTKTNVISIKELNLELTTKQKRQQVYANAHHFSDHNHYKFGSYGQLTTCGFDPPHYFLEAESFIIYPEKRIIGQNVRFVNPVGFLPLGFWSPAYVFDLGKRKVIYLMPVIGNNQIEGGFFKSQVDYVLTDHWTGEAFIDYLSQKGIGLGTRLNYNNFDNLDGDIYYYGVTDTEYNIKEWNQTIQLSNEDKLTTHFQSKNMYLIQGGTSASDKNLISFEKKAIDGTHTAVYSFNQSHLSTLKPKDYHISYSKKGDDSSSTSLSYKRSENSVKSDAINIGNNQYIGHNINSQSNFSFYQKELAQNDLRKDSYLKTQQSFSKQFKHFGTVKTSIDYYFDTDSDTVTEDIKNHVVQKIPEIDLALNSIQLNNAWTINQSYQYGYYEEQYFITSLNKQREYSQSRFNLSQNLNGHYTYNLMNGRLYFNAFYNQYYYASGDQTFTIGNNTTYETDSFSFFKTKTSHERTWVPTNGNTPFYFDEREQIEKNELRETLTLYLLSPQKYALKYSSGYNWIVNYQLDNEYELLLRPNKVFRNLFRTTYLLQQHRYSPLVGRFDITPSKMFETSLQANYDLNKGEMINLNHVISGSTSRQWENRWIFKAYFTYAPKYNQDYQLQTLSLTKDLHERKLTLIYNRLLEEYRFQFTINAFPDNNLGFTSNKYESIRLEGVFDDESVQR